MQRTAFALVLALASCASVPNPGRTPPPVHDTSSQFDLYLGVRGLHESDWWPVENQGTLGLEFVHEVPGSIVGFELGLFASGAKQENAANIEVRGRTSEVSVGLHKTFVRDGSIRPYIGGGVAAIRAQVKGDGGNASAEDDDGSGALYAHGGVAFDLGPSLMLGLDLRVLGGSDVTLFGNDATADYAQVALVLGVAF